MQASAFMGKFIMFNNIRYEQIELYLMENKGNWSNRFYYISKDSSLKAIFYVFLSQKSRVIFPFKSDVCLVV